MVLHSCNPNTERLYWKTGAKQAPLVLAHLGLYSEIISFKKKKVGLFFWDMLIIADLIQSTIAF